MEQVNRMIFGLFLCIAGWQDFKTKSVSVWVFMIFMIPPWITGKGILGMGFLVGILLLILNNITKNGIGSGDGWFFVISGIYFNIEDNFYILLSGLMLCSLYGLGFILYGGLTGKKIKKQSVPFIPFLLPAGIWMVLK